MFSLCVLYLSGIKNIILFPIFPYIERRLWDSNIHRSKVKRQENIVPIKRLQVMWHIALHPVWETSTKPTWLIMDSFLFLHRWEPCEKTHILPVNRMDISCLSGNTVTLNEVFLTAIICLNYRWWNITVNKDNGDGKRFSFLLLPQT